MDYTPQNGDVVDMFLSEHSEKRVYQRFPRLRLKTDFDAVISHCVSDLAEPMWSIQVQGGHLIGKLEKAKEGSKIKGIFIVQTALYNWQFRRSKFSVVESVPIHFRRINSQIQNKLKDGKMVTPDALIAANVTMAWQNMGAHV